MAVNMQTVSCWEVWGQCFIVNNLGRILLRYLYPFFSLSLIVSRLKTIFANSSGSFIHSDSRGSDLFVRCSCSFLCCSQWSSSSASSFDFTFSCFDIMYHRFEQYLSFSSQDLLLDEVALLYFQLRLFSCDAYPLNLKWMVLSSHTLL